MGGSERGGAGLLLTPPPPRAGLRGGIDRVGQLAVGLQREAGKPKSPAQMAS